MAAPHPIPPAPADHGLRASGCGEERGPRAPSGEPATEPAPTGDPNGGFRPPPRGQREKEQCAGWGTRPGVRLGQQGLEPRMAGSTGTAIQEKGARAAEAGEGALSPGLCGSGFPRPASPFLTNVARSGPRAEVTRVQQRTPRGSQRCSGRSAVKGSNGAFLNPQVPPQNKVLLCVSSHRNGCRQLLLQTPWAQLSLQVAGPRAVPGRPAATQMQRPERGATLTRQFTGWRAKA